MQPVVIDPNGRPRFKPNAIVARLHAEGIVNLNTIASWDVAQEDAEQFWQLLGGYAELSFIGDESVAEAEAAAVQATWRASQKGGGS